MDSFSGSWPSSPRSHFFPHQLRSVTSKSSLSIWPVFFACGWDFPVVMLQLACRKHLRTPYSYSGQGRGRREQAIRYTVIGKVWSFFPLIITPFSPFSFNLSKKHSRSHAKTYSPVQCRHSNSPLLDADSLSKTCGPEYTVIVQRNWTKSLSTGEEPVWIPTLTTAEISIKSCI